MFAYKINVDNWNEIDGTVMNETFKCTNFMIIFI